MSTSTDRRHNGSRAAAPLQTARGGGAGRRRADAQRSITAILDAALDCFVEDPDVSMTAIARAAGVGRVTLYAHFPSREALLDAVLERAVAGADAALAQEDLDGVPAPEALEQLLRSSWEILDRHRRLMVAAARHLGPVRLRERHTRVLARVERLIARGQDEGAFRTDVPRDWLVTVTYSLLHAAAEEVNAQRLPSSRAASVLASTLLPALAGPAQITASKKGSRRRR
jgi:AcrR family transcriptional regulator